MSSAWNRRLRMRDSGDFGPLRIRPDHRLSLGGGCNGGELVYLRPAFYLDGGDAVRCRCRNGQHVRPRGDGPRAHYLQESNAGRGVVRSARHQWPILSHRRLLRKAGLSVHTGNRGGFLVRPPLRDVPHGSYFPRDGTHTQGTHPAPRNPGSDGACPRRREVAARKGAPSSGWRRSWPRHDGTSPVEDRAIVGIEQVAVLPVMVDLVGQGVLVQFDPQAETSRHVHVALGDLGRLLPGNLLPSSPVPDKESWECWPPAECLPPGRSAPADCAGRWSLSVCLGQASDDPALGDAADVAQVRLKDRRRPFLQHLTEPRECPYPVAAPGICCSCRIRASAAGGPPCPTPWITSAAPQNVVREEIGGLALSKLAGAEEKFVRK